MSLVNENFLELQDNYLFSTIAKKVEQYQKQNPNKKIIKLGIGDVTLPIVPAVIEATKKAIKEMAQKETFKGYGPEQGYEFLKQQIVKEYKEKGVIIKEKEIFISDGAKSDTANIQELFSGDNKIGITNPVYPVYEDSNIISGKGKNIIYIPMREEEDFIPQIPTIKLDLIYLCSPNNPTGIALNKKQLEEWVSYAKQNEAIILFDVAYEAFIQEAQIPHSIYEIDEAKEVAIEFASFSKSAGFTGMRCAYTIIPEEVKAKTIKGDNVSINKLWNRRQCTKFNGVPYIIQRAAEAVYTKEAKKQIQKNINYYRNNAKIIIEGLKEKGIKTYGGINSPYIWLKTPKNYTSWEFFDKLLQNAGVVGTPGVGFGKNGEGYFRLTAFNSQENTRRSSRKNKKINIAK